MTTAKEEPGAKPNRIWMDGKMKDSADATVHIMAHALHYGTGVFEGIRCYKTPEGPAVFRLREHLERMDMGAKFYGMPMPYSVEQLFEATKEVVRTNGLEECYLRPIAFRGAGPIGLDPTSAPVNVAVIATNMGKYFDEKKMEAGLKCHLSKWRRINAKIIPPHVKACGQYINSVLARVEAKNAGYDEAIMLNINERVSEGTGENIFIVDKGGLFTPPLSEDILNGITRNSVMKIAADMGMKAEEKPLELEELFSADEVFMTGTAAEVMPIASIDSKAVGGGKRGPITTKLQKKYMEVVRGMDSNYRDWLAYV